MKVKKRENKSWDWEEIFIEENDVANFLSSEKKSVENIINNFTEEAIKNFTEENEEEVNEKIKNALELQENSLIKLKEIIIESDSSLSKLNEIAEILNNFETDSNKGNGSDYVLEYHF